MIFTLFLSPLHQVYEDNVDDASQSKDLYRFVGDSRFNILYQRIEQFSLDNLATRSITYANYVNTDWAFIIAKVVGSVRINTSGVDFDNSTSISGKLPIYGTSLFPGIGILSTYNVNSFTVESLADDSTVELYAAIAAADDDTRIDTNA